MQPKDQGSPASDDAADKKAPPRRFEGTLPMGKPGEAAQARRDSDGDLDLDLGDIQTRLPYGSEDIADK